MQQRVIDLGIDAPFIAYPPGSGFGRFAKANGSEVSDAEVGKLNEANIMFGDKQLMWERMSSESSHFDPFP